MAWIVFWDGRAVTYAKLNVKRCSRPSSRWQPESTAKLGCGFFWHWLDWPWLLRLQFFHLPPAKPETWWPPQYLPPWHFCWRATGACVPFPFFPPRGGPRVGAVPLFSTLGPRGVATEVRRG